ncbi:MAG: hypothetical protein VKL39_01725, partial [Leptolyngbyaceae bacterium]|nr:hypothetical protein [Leptolyngbyaceae bacterium]
SAEGSATCGLTRLDGVLSRGRSPDMSMKLGLSQKNSSVVYRFTTGCVISQENYNDLKSTLKRVVSQTNIWFPDSGRESLQEPPAPN